MTRRRFGYLNVEYAVYTDLRDESVVIGVWPLPTRGASRATFLPAIPSTAPPRPGADWDEKRLFTKVPISRRALMSTSQAFL